MRNRAAAAAFAARMTFDLDRLSIASPCNADWSRMTGDAKRRYCAQCKLHVHDLRAMTAAEAQEFLRAANGKRVCVRLHRRADGMVLTSDCPVGLRQRMRRAWARAVALWAAIWSAAACARTASPTPNAGPEPVQPRALMGEVEMGDMVAPPPKVEPKPDPK